MTGFARQDGSGEGLAWAWEARSVNGRGLDIRLRLPPGFDAIDAAVRETVTKRISRGNVTINLTTERQNGTGTVRLNEGVLQDILKASDRVAEMSGGARPDTAALLTMKGVLEIGDNGLDDPEQRAVRERLLIKSFEETADKLVASRRSEGARLGQIISAQLVEIERMTGEVRASPSRTPETIRLRMQDLVSRLLEASGTFDKDRLHQEAVLAATRADVEEELARLTAHVAAAREILDEKSAVGRKLDFLAQEFNREANTLCSKANAVDVTRIGLGLKSVIDHLREQVQNVE